MTWERRAGNVQLWQALPSTHFRGRVGTQTQADPTPETSPTVVLPRPSPSRTCCALAAAVLPPQSQSESRGAGRRAQRGLATRPRLQVTQPGKALSWVARWPGADSGGRCFQTVPLGDGGQEREGPEKTTLQRTPSPSPREGLQIPWAFAPFSLSRVASVSLTSLAW